jgi:Condensation domain
MTTDTPALQVDFRAPPGDDSLNQIGWIPIPPGTEPGAVVAALRIILERHDSLRSVYFETGGEPGQRVLAAGRLPLRVSEAVDPDMEAATEAAGLRLKQGAFDIAHDLPLRAELLTRGGEPWALVLVVSHMSADGWSISLVKRELTTLLEEGPAEGVLPPRGRQPVDRAAFEHTEQGAARERLTLQQWTGTLEQASATMLEKPAGPAASVGDWGRIDSPAAASAAAALAAAAGVNPGSVVLAALALLLGFRVAEPRATLRVIVTPRFTAADRFYVGAFNQNALFHVEIDEDEPAVGFLRRAGAGAFGAYRRCEADPRKVEQLVADVAERRGFTPDGYCFFNDVRFAFADRSAPDADQPPADPAEIAASLDRTVLEQLHKDERQKGAKLFLYLQELGPSCRITACLDPAFLGPYRITALLGDLERLLVRAASAPHEPVGALRPAWTHDGSAPQLTDQGKVTP